MAIDGKRVLTFQKWPLVPELKLKISKSAVFFDIFNFTNAPLYTVPQKKRRFLKVACPLGNSVYQWTWHSFTVLKCLRVTDPNAVSPGKIDEENVTFFWWRVYYPDRESEEKRGKEGESDKRGSNSIKPQKLWENHRNFDQRVAKVSESMGLKG